MLEVCNVKSEHPVIVLTSIVLYFQAHGIDVDIFKFRKLFFPVNENYAHWILGVVDFAKEKFSVLDPYQAHAKPRPSLIHHLKRYLEDEHLDKKGAPLPYDFWDNWEFVDIDHAIPFQTNGASKCSAFASARIPTRRLTSRCFVNKNADFDCGVFVCLFAHLLSLGQPLDFRQEDITRFGREFVGDCILQLGAAFPSDTTARE